MTKRAVGMGIANIDIIFSGIDRIPSLGEELYSKAYSCQLGGGPLATLIQLKRLGVPVKIGTYIGTGKLSTFLKRELNKNGAAVENMLETEEEDPVTLSCVMSCPRDRGIMSCRPDPSVFAMSREKIKRFYDGADIVYLSADQKELCRELKEQGSVVVLDSSWSEDNTMECYREILPYTDFFIPNEKEAMMITGEKTAERALLALAPYQKIPIIKCGAAGCIFLENGNIERIPPIPVKYRDATGAGDAFAAGFLYGLCHGRSIESCLCYGNIAGGNAVSAVGCLSTDLNEGGIQESYKCFYEGSDREVFRQKRREGA